MVRFCFLLTLITISSYAQSSFSPFPFLQNNSSIKHILIAEKSTHKLFVYQNFPEIKLLKTLPMTTGLNSGDKLKEGDKKTPEGIYFFSQFLSRAKLKERIPKKLLHLYGKGAFTSDYPNFYDRFKKKTGSGIWLHSSDDPQRVYKKRDTRGCPIIPGDELLKLTNIIEFNKTPIIIVKDLHFWSNEKKKLQVNEIYQSFKKMKQGQNKKLEDLNIITHNNYAVILEENKQFFVKTYLRLNNKYQWKYLSQKKHRTN